MASASIDTDKLLAMKTNIEKRLIAAGFQIEREAKQLCPVDQGRLRASISTNWTESGKAEGDTDAQAEEWDGVLSSDVIDDGNFKVVVGTNVFYGPFIEFGTYKMAGIPFMRASFGKYSDRITKLLAEANQVGNVNGDTI